MTIRRTSPISRLLLCSLFVPPAVPAAVAAGQKLTVHLVYMTPYGTDARNTSRAGGGVGAAYAMTLPGAKEVLSGVIGLEFVNLLHRSTGHGGFIDGEYLSYRKDTDQWYGRLKFGAQAGGFGNGFFRPYAGLGAALVFYAINTSLTYMPDFGEEYSESVYDDIDAVFGCDITLGMDLNAWETVSIDGGVRYLKSFSVPDQLGEGAETVHPQYFQAYLGVGFAIMPGDGE